MSGPSHDPRHTCSLPLLGRLIDHFALREAGEPTEGALERLLALPTSEQPVQLLDVLARAAHLTSRRAHDAFVEGFGGVLFKQELVGLTAADVAVLAFLEHRELYNRITATYGMQTQRKFRAFRGRARRMREPLTCEELESLATWLGAGFESRNRSRHCQIYAFELDGLQYFDISHGDPVKRRSAVVCEDGTTRTVTIEYRPEGRDRVIYDPVRGLLRITARLEATMNAYRDAFGIALHEQKGWFQPAGTVDLDPLVERGPEALSLVPGLRDAKLIRLYSRHPNGLGDKKESGDVMGDVMELVGDQKHLLHLVVGEPIKAWIALTAADGRKGVLRLGLPSDVSKPRTLAAEATAFMRRNGFARRLDEAA